MLHLTNAKEYTSIHLDVNSIGGFVDEAKKIVDLLKASGKVHSASNSGDVMSSAVEIFMLAPYRTFDVTKGGFLIHNPWNETQGDASDHEAVTKQLKKIEDTFATTYSDKTGTDKEVIKMLMKENRPLTSEEIKTYNFATLVERQEVQAKAIYKQKTNQMTNEEIDKKLDSFGAKLTKTIKAMFKPKAMLVVDADGNEIELPEINDITELKVDLSVTGVSDGTYTLTDGRIITVAGGKITEIMEVETEMSKLQKENETLKAEIEAKKIEIEAKQVELTTVETEKIEAMAKFTELEKEFKSIRSSYKPKAEARTEDDDQKPKAFTFKKK